MKRPAKLGKADKELIAAATAAIKQRYRYDWQGVGAALRTRSGEIFTASISTPIGPHGNTQEAVALGRSFIDLGDAAINTRLALRRPIPRREGSDHRGGIAVRRLRELIFDYIRNARVIVPNGKSAALVPIGELLPNKYRRGPRR